MCLCILMKGHGKALCLRCGALRMCAGNTFPILFQWAHVTLFWITHGSESININENEYITGESLLRILKGLNMPPRNFDPRPLSLISHHRSF
jgi:hypothetical protein